MSQHIQICSQRSHNCFLLRISFVFYSKQKTRLSDFRLYTSFPIRVATPEFDGTSDNCTGEMEKLVVRITPQEQMCERNKFIVLTNGKVAEKSMNRPNSKDIAQTKYLARDRQRSKDKKELCTSFFSPDVLWSSKRASRGVREHRCRSRAYRVVHVFLVKVLQDSRLGSLDCLGDERQISKPELARGFQSSRSLGTCDKHTYC